MSAPTHRAELQAIVDVALECLVLEGKVKTTWDERNGQRRYHLADGCPCDLCTEKNNGVLYG